MNLIYRIEIGGNAEEFPGEKIREMRLVHSKLPNKTSKKVYVRRVQQSSEKLEDRIRYKS